MTLWQMLRRLTCFMAFMIALAGAAAADPKSPQCWDCLRRLAMELPAVNAQEDPSYEEGLTPGSVLPALSYCSFDDGQIPTLQQIIRVFTDAQAEHGGDAYVGDHLARMPEVSADDRAKLVDGATQDLDTTLRHLVDHNCRLLLQSHFDEGASQKWILQMIGSRANVARAFLSGLPMDVQPAYPLDNGYPYRVRIVTAMLVTYALEDCSPWFIVAFAGACVLASLRLFSRELGPLVLLRPSGQWLPCVATG
jgi:hypothetical protein